MLQQGDESNKESSQIPDQLYHKLLELATSEKDFILQIKDLIKILMNHAEPIRKLINKKNKEDIESARTHTRLLSLGNSEATELQQAKYNYFKQKNSVFISQENFNEIIMFLKTMITPNDFRNALDKLKGISLFLIASDRMIDTSLEEKYIHTNGIILQKDENEQIHAYYFKDGKRDQLILNLEELELDAKQRSYLQFPEKTEDIVTIEEESAYISLVAKISKKCGYKRFNGANCDEITSDLLNGIYDSGFINMLAAMIKFIKIYNTYLGIATNITSTDLSNFLKEEREIYNHSLIKPMQRFTKLILFFADMVKILTEIDKTNRSLVYLQMVWRKYARCVEHGNSFVGNLKKEPFLDDYDQLCDDLTRGINASELPSNKKGTFKDLATAINNWFLSAEKDDSDEKELAPSENNIGFLMAAIREHYIQQLEEENSAVIEDNETKPQENNPGEKETPAVEKEVAAESSTASWNSSKKPKQLTQSNLIGKRNEVSEQDLQGKGIAAPDSSNNPVVGHICAKEYKEKRKKLPGEFSRAEDDSTNNPATPKERKRDIAWATVTGRKSTAEGLGQFYDRTTQSVNRKLDRATTSLYGAFKWQNEEEASSNLDDNESKNSGQSNDDKKEEKSPGSSISPANLPGVLGLHK